MNFDLILRNAKLVSEKGFVSADIGVLDGKIVQIGSVSGEAKIEKDLKGLVVLPGLIDMHVHFRDPGFPQKEDFASGSRAAAAGGVTTVIDMPNTNPPTLTCAALEQKREIAKAKSCVNFGFYMGLAKDNLDEIARAKNLVGVKVYMGSTTGNLLIEDLNIIEKLFALNKFMIVHAEDESIIRANTAKYADSTDPSVHSLIRAPEAAMEAAKTILHLAKKCNGQVHITHLSTAGEIELLRKFASRPSHSEAKQLPFCLSKTSFKVSADTAPHYLFFTQADYAAKGTFVKMNPPIRTKEDQKALWEALRDGTIPVIATDHAPHTKEEKSKPYKEAPSGVPGVETLLPLLLDAVNHGELTLRDVVKLTSENPAKLLHLKGKGSLAVGADADLTVIDMEKEQKVGEHGYFSKSGWSPFEGRKLKGWPIITIVGGRVAFENGKVNEEVRGKEIEVAR